MILSDLVGRPAVTEKRWSGTQNGRSRSGVIEIGRSTERLFGRLHAPIMLVTFSGLSVTKSRFHIDDSVTAMLTEQCHFWQI